MSSNLLSIFKMVLILLPTFLLNPVYGFYDGKLLSQSETVRPDGRLDFFRSDGKIVASILIEIAETPEARRKGLMGRQTLGMTNGMLFIYNRESMLDFWMHNTLISLDIIFVDKDRRVIHIVENTIPMSKQTYNSKRPAQVVIEVPAGFVKHFNIHSGMLIEWRRR